jgi:polyhydroxyalkanoate synthesis regulator phasin
MAEPENMILRQLRDMRTSIDRNAEATTERFDRIDKRLDNIRQAITGESVLGRYAAAEVEERLAAIEKRLSDLEQHR